jgi:hypothetical protein
MLINEIDLNELIQREEPLLRELEYYVQSGPLGPMVHHPLIIETFYRPGYCGLINASYSHKKQRAEEFLRDKKWRSYIYLVERPYRLDALHK